MADLLTAQPEIDQYSLDEIGQTLQSFLIEEAVMLSKITDISFMAQKGVKTIFVPSMETLPVKDKTQKVAIEADEIVDGGDQLLLDKHKYANFFLEDEADAKSRVNLVQGALERMSKEMALQVDKDIIAAIAAASAGTAQAAATMGRVDVLELRRLLRKANLKPQELYLGVNPDKEKELLDIDEFIFANEYGKNPAGIETGVLGSIFGVKVFVHDEIDPDASLMFHPSACAYASMWGMRYQKEYELEYLAERHAVDMLYGVKALDGGARSKKLTPFVP